MAFSSIKALLLFGGLSSIGVSAAALGGAFSVAQVAIQKAKVPPGYQKYDCYKWFFDMEKGEMLICLDKKVGEAETSSLEGRSTFYTLWWKDPAKPQGPWPYYDFEQIKVEKGNEISFTFKDSAPQQQEKKITVKKALPGAVVTRWSDRLTNLEKLNGKSLKSACKLTNESNTKSVKLECSTEGYAVSGLDHTSRWIKRSFNK